MDAFHPNRGAPGEAFGAPEAVPDEVRGPLGDAESMDPNNGGSSPLGKMILNKNQGLVNVPFWEYWTSPYSSHYRPYT